MYPLRCYFWVLCPGLWLPPASCSLVAAAQWWQGCQIEDFPSFHPKIFPQDVKGSSQRHHSQLTFSKLNQFFLQLTLRWVLGVNKPHKEKVRIRLKTQSQNKHFLYNTNVWGLRTFIPLFQHLLCKYILTRLRLLDFYHFCLEDFDVTGWWRYPPNTWGWYFGLAFCHKGLECAFNREKVIETSALSVSEESHFFFLVFGVYQHSAIRV